MNSAASAEPGAFQVRPPLHGVRVLDLTHAVAGPVCTLQLGLLGAEILKIEKPGVGDDLRHYTEHAGTSGMSSLFIAANSGKKSIVIDLKTSEGLEVIKQLVSLSDVLVENFRPGSLGKLGLDYESVVSLCPDIIYCSVSGFGQEGDFRSRTAYDHIAQAMSGIMFINGDDGTPPLKVGLGVADVFSGHVAALGIVAALLNREHTGRGEYVDVSMLDALFSLMAMEAGTHSITGAEPLRSGNRGLRRVASAETYETGDGYLALGANSQAQFESLCHIIGTDELLSDERFATHDARVQNDPALRDLLREALQRNSAAHWESELATASVPAARVRTLREALADSRAAERSVVRQVRPSGSDTTFATVTRGFRYQGDKSGAREEHLVPALGEDTEAVLRQLGIDETLITSVTRTLKGA